MVNWQCVDDDYIPQRKVVEECFGRGAIGLLAIHGGKIEPGTESVLRYVNEKAGAKCYLLSGRLKDNNFLLLHGHSHQFPITRQVFQRWLNGVQLAISLHGHKKGHNLQDPPHLQSVVFVGGNNRTLAAQFCGIARTAMPSYTWIDNPNQMRIKNPNGSISDLSGSDTNNPVNLPQDDGIQFELPRSLRNPIEKWCCPPEDDSLVFAKLLTKFVIDLQRQYNSAPACPSWLFLGIHRLRRICCWVRYLRPCR